MRLYALNCLSIRWISPRYPYHVSMPAIPPDTAQNDAVPVMPTFEITHCFCPSKNNARLQYRFFCNRADLQMPEQDRFQNE